MASPRVVDLAGLPILIEADNPERWAIVDHVLAALPLSTTEPRLRIRYTAEGIAPPCRPADAIRDGIELWRQDVTLTALHPLGLVSQVDDQVAEIGGTLDPSPLGFRHLFQIAVTHLLAHHDRFVLHGGGIVSGQGSFLVLGGSGFGKSTLTVAAWLAGWPVMCDDLIIARHDGHDVALMGLPRPWVVPADMAKQAGLAGRPAVADLRDRHWVEGATFTQGWFPAAGCILVGHGEGRPPPEALSSHEALQMILGSFFCTGDAQLARKFLPVAASLARLSTWRLHHASDPADRLSSAVANLMTIGGGPSTS
jgi:hypothetical protein